jgi:hypothetical protein
MIAKGVKVCYCLLVAAPLSVCRASSLQLLLRKVLTVRNGFKQPRNKDLPINCFLAQQQIFTAKTCDAISARPVGIHLVVYMKNTWTTLASILVELYTFC